MALTKVDMIIKELCRITGEPEYRNYDSFIGPVRRGFLQLNIAAVPVAKTTYLTANRYNAINWPIDCIKPIALNLIRNGCPITLDVDPNILPPNQDVKNKDCCTIAEADNMIDAIAASENYPTWYFGNGEFYGLGNGFNTAGYVNHDHATRQSFIKSTSIREDDSFALLYLSDGISDGLEYVPTVTEPAIISYALHEYYRVKSPSLSAVEYEKFKEQLTFLRKVFQSYTIEDWRTAVTWNEKSSPK